MKRLAVVLLVAAAGLAAVLFVRAWRFRPESHPTTGARPKAVDSRPVADHLAAAVRFHTVSHEGGGAVEAEAFNGLRAWLEATYPAVHRTLGARS